MLYRLPPYAEINGQPSRPSEEQVRFHSAARQHTYTYLMGGMGSGKSWAGAVHFLRLILGNRAELQAKGHGNDEAVYLAGAPTYQLIAAGPWSHLLQLFRDAERINGVPLLACRPKKTQPPEMRLVTGDVIEFISTDAGRYAGRTAMAWWYDECDHPLCSDPVGGFNLLDDRLRDNRISHRVGICTSTPPVSVVGVAHLFAERIQAGDTQYARVQARTASNPYHAGTDYISRRSATMSARERRIKLEGEVLSPTGTVYCDEFDIRDSIDRQWIWRSARRRRQAGRQVLIGIDWPPSAHALLLEYDPGIEPLWEQASAAPIGSTTRRRAELAARGRTPYVVFDEVLGEAWTPEHFCREIVGRCEQWGIAREEVAGVYCDAMPRYARQVAHRPEFWEGKAASRVVKGTQGDKECGIDTVRWALEDGEGRRRLKFAARLLTSPHRRGIVKSMQNYQEIQAVRDGLVIRTGRFDNASPWGHGPDALRYLMWIRESHRRFYDGRRVAA